MPRYAASHLTILALWVTMMIVGCSTKAPTDQPATIDITPSEAPEAIGQPPSRPDPSREKAAAEYLRGLYMLQQGKAQEARKAFLLALFHDPDHQPVQAGLAQISPRFHISYTVKDGDTLGSIAHQQYGSANYYPYIMATNNLVSEALQIGQVLELPIFTTSEPESDTDLLSKGENLLSKGHFLQVKEIAEAILTENGQDPAARRLRNHAVYGLAQQSLTAGKLEAAYIYLKELDTSYEDTAEKLRETRLRLAEKHYKEGVKRYTEENLERAIDEWHKTLEFNPDHSHARRDLKNVQALQKKLESID